MEQIIINKNLFKARSFEQLFDEYEIDEALAMKIQALPLANVIDGYVDMGDTRMLTFKNFIKEEFGDYTLEDVLLTLLKLRQIRLDNEREVKSKMRFIRAVCESQPVENEDGTKNVYLLPTDSVNFINEHLEREEKNFRIPEGQYSQEKYLNSCILFDEDTATYYFNVSEIKEPMTIEKFTELWKGE